mmetsp:Transcript_14705/g.35060  ORF Transcript_14705/g.35060 Transcript_14705/m.35060 type:complete len:259 (-) Transcript_14705:354-1130(-)
MHTSSMSRSSSVCIPPDRHTHPSPGPLLSTQSTSARYPHREHVSQSKPARLLSGSHTCIHHARRPRRAHVCLSVCLFVRLCFPLPSHYMAVCGVCVSGHPSLFLFYLWPFPLSAIAAVRRRRPVDVGGRHAVARLLLVEVVVRVYVCVGDWHHLTVFSASISTGYVRACRPGWASWLWLWEWWWSLPLRCRVWSGRAILADDVPSLPLPWCRVLARASMSASMAWMLATPRWMCLSMRKVRIGVMWRDQKWMPFIRHL